MSHTSLKNNITRNVLASMLCVGLGAVALTGCTTPDQNACNHTNGCKGKTTAEKNSCKSANGCKAASKDGNGCSSKEANGCNH